MTTNKTSEAVKELAEKWSAPDEDIVSRHSARNCRTMQAIVQKFRRMEETLQTYASWEEDNPPYDHNSVAHEALSFDPLND